MAEKCAEASSSESCSTPQDERPSGNWWDSWLSSAKTKSAEVYTMVKKDLDEIGSAVKSEASHVYNSTSTVIGKTLKLDVPESPANAMKKSFSTFIGQVSTVLNPEPDDEDDTEVILSSGDTTMLSTYKKELEALQRVDATFIVPAYSPEFEAWLASLENTEAGVITPSAAIRRLDTSTILKQQYEKLVPDAVSHEEFWERYLFRVALLQDKLAAASRRSERPERPPTTDPVLAHLPLSTQPQSPKKVASGPDSQGTEPSCDTSEVDNVVAWEDEDFADDVELTEEQQILLLEEYEKEIASKKQSKPSSPPRDVANNNTKTTNTDNKSKNKAAQTRDKMNNRTDDKNQSPKNVKKLTNNIDGKTTDITVRNGGKTTDNKNKNDGKAITDNKNKNGGRSPKKGAKTDVCGNDLVEDYFGDKEVKDDASANSDESWEKDFEVEDVEKV